MSFDDQSYEQIASYLNNEMSNEERTAFEALLKSDAELAAFVATFSSLESVYNEDTWNIKSNASIEEVKTLANEFRAKDVLDLSDKIRDIQQAANHIHTTKSKKSYFYYISSAVAVAAVMTLFYFTFMQSLTANDAFIRYHDWSTLPSFQIKSDTLINVSEAEALFKQQKYQEALTIFKKYEQESATYDTQIQLYIGVSYLELNKYQEAMQIFDTLLQSNTLDNHKAYWYKALTYLKQNDAENAKRVLEKLIENADNYNYEKAKKVLKKLK